MQRKIYIVQNLLFFNYYYYYYFRLCCLHNVSIYICKGLCSQFISIFPEVRYCPLLHFNKQLIKVIYRYIVLYETQSYPTIENWYLEVSYYHVHKQSMLFYWLIAVPHAPSGLKLANLYTTK